jgi:hypothetical protein
VPDTGWKPPDAAETAAATQQGDSEFLMVSLLSIAFVSFVLFVVSPSAPNSSCFPEFLITS